MAGVAASAGRSLLGSAIPGAELNWTMVDLVEAGARKQVGAKCLLRNSQKSWRTKRPKAPEGVSKSACLAVEWVDDAVVTSSPGASLVADQRIGESTRRLASTRVKAVS